jgi:predicted ATPase
VWKFEVENIGKVSRAEISMAPLVLLVGRNNTGKSYIATLLWALSNAQTLIWREDSSEHRPDWYNAFVAQVENEPAQKLQITEKRANELIEYFNLELARNGRELLREVFAYDGFERTSFRVEADRPFVPFSVTVAASESPEPDKRRSPIIRYSIVEAGALFARRFFRVPTLAGGPMFGDRLVVALIYRILLGPNSRGRTLYIPAARTGLMLSLRMLITQLFEEDAPPARLPRPLIDFLRRLTIGSSQQEPVATWLQNEIMHGKIEVSEGEAPSFTYVPENTNMSVPLHAASSMITELAPFLILLNQGLSTMHQIIFEEPEAHLHLSAQRSMARALARLINSGVNVLVTTHSDTFVQQINNLMHLYNHPQKSELMRSLGYEDADLINPANTKAYEFSESGNQTNVSEVRMEVEGFVVPTLNDTLAKLANETITLQEGGE